MYLPKPGLTIKAVKIITINQYIIIRIERLNEKNSSLSPKPGDVQNNLTKTAINLLCLINKKTYAGVYVI